MNYILIEYLYQSLGSSTNKGKKIFSNPESAKKFILSTDKERAEKSLKYIFSGNCVLNPLQKNNGFIFRINLVEFVE